MTTEELVPEGIADSTAREPGDLRYGAYYYSHDCGIPYERNEHWTQFFGSIADSIVSRLHPSTVLDAGCAIGMLVEALRARSVEAFGVDVSEWAIDKVAPSVREHCWCASLSEPLPRHYDLITCIEVIEHIPEPDASRAIAHLCQSADRILVSSSPFDYSEPTHVNVRPPEHWARQFAEHGFVRNLEFDASFITPWAALYERTNASLPEVVGEFERVLFRLREEVSQVRARSLQMQRHLEDGYGDGEDFVEQVERLRHELLTGRDELIGTEAELGVALGRVRELEDELDRRAASENELAGIRRSPVWRYYEPYWGFRKRLVARLRDALRRLR